MLGVLVVLAAGAFAQLSRRDRARAFLLKKARDHRAPLKMRIEPVDANSPAPGGWAVPIWADDGPWPVRSWWPQDAGVPYAYSDQHNMSS